MKNKKTLKQTVVALENCEHAGSRRLDKIEAVLRSIAAEYVAEADSMGWSEHDIWQSVKDVIAEKMASFNGNVL